MGARLVRVALVLVFAAILVGLASLGVVNADRVPFGIVVWLIRIVGAFLILSFVLGALHLAWELARGRSPS